MALKKSKKAVEAAPVSEPVITKVKTTSKSKPVAKEKDNIDGIVVIDYPTKGEVVSGLHYGIRVGSVKDGQVEISFNNAEWLPCRPAHGYWWYDWGYFTPGTYKIAARLIDPQGKVISKSQTTTCKVV
jgi:hypothetical protein